MNHPSEAMLEYIIQLLVPDLAPPVYSGAYIGTVFCISATIYTAIFFSKPLKSLWLRLIISADTLKNAKNVCSAERVLYALCLLSRNSEPNNRHT